MGNRIIGLVLFVLIGPRQTFLLPSNIKLANPVKLENWVINPVNHALLEFFENTRPAHIIHIYIYISF